MYRYVYKWYIDAHENVNTGLISFTYVSVEVQNLV